MRQIEHIRFSKGGLSKVSAAALLALALCACGGGSDTHLAIKTPPPTPGGTPPPAPDVTAPTATSSQTGAALQKSASIVISFSEAMNPASLQLSGTLVALSTGGVWSKTNADNDTLTLSPQGGNWTSGPGRTLNVDAKDVAGNALVTIKASYIVPLALDMFQAAAVVIGQADFQSMAQNQNGGPAANTLRLPLGNPGVTDDGRLFVGDSSNNRVLAYNALPPGNNADANFVLGQPTFFVAPFNVNLGSHPGAQQTVVAGGKLIVADTLGHRVVIYNSMPANGAAVQSVVVGQPDFGSSVIACTDSRLLSPESVAATPDGKLIVTDSAHNRVLIWNTIPVSDGQKADVVLGQDDFTHCAANDANQDGAFDGAPTAFTLNYPAGVWTDGTRLAVIDQVNNRVLIWNKIPATNFASADVVLGQKTFTSRTRNDDNQDGVVDAAPTARTLSFPYEGISSNGVQLAVADQGNHRVLIWNSFPTVNFQAADVVLGQNDFGHNVADDVDQDGLIDALPSAQTLFGPSGVLFHGDRLLVTDTVNNRVLIFKSK